MQPFGFPVLDQWLPDGSPESFAGMLVLVIAAVLVIEVTRRVENSAPVLVIFIAAAAVAYLSGLVPVQLPH
jgi:hypothetical protein